MQLYRKAKSFAKKRLIMPAVRRLRDLMNELEDVPVVREKAEFDNAYPWLNYELCKLLCDPFCKQKLAYAWGVIQGAALARVLCLSRISVIEFGVAMGAGLKCLEHIAETVEEDTKVSIEVFGFDSGVGLPKPQDYRDQPNMWLEGQLPMNRNQLERELKKASLRIGPVSETVSDFLKENPPPVAFVSFDLDLYRSTKDALELFSCDYDRLLPRVVCYFDDIFGHTYSDYTGERLAIVEFNRKYEVRKLSPIYGLRYFVPVLYQEELCWDCLYFAHFFDHPLYDIPDSFRKTVYADGKVCIRCPVDSDWRDIDLFTIARTKRRDSGYVNLTTEEVSKKKLEKEHNQSTVISSAHHARIQTK